MFVGHAIRAKSSSAGAVSLFMCEDRSDRFYSRMANLVTNLNTEEGGDVGLETLLQTYVAL